MAYTFSKKNMNTIRAFVLCALTLFSDSAFGAQNLHTDFADVSKLSELIITAIVVKVVPMKFGREDIPYDELTLKVASTLKGELKDMSVKIVTEPRGMRDFDPLLKVGESGVFFLIKDDKFGYRFAARGAVAIFTRGNFVLKDDKNGEQGAPSNR